MDFLMAVLASILAVFFCAFFPKIEWLAAQVIEAAVKRMPEPHQDRMREEWHAELADKAGGFWTLFWAVDLLRGAGNIADELKQIEAEQASSQRQSIAELDKDRNYERRVSTAPFRRTNNGDDDPFPGIKDFFEKVGSPPKVTAKSCKICGGVLSSNVETCIHCGTSEPIKKKELPLWPWAVAFSILIVALLL